MRKQSGMHNDEVIAIYFNVSDDAVEINRNSPKRLWSTVDHLLGRGRLPVNSAVEAEDLGRYFEENVADVQAATADATPPVFTYPTQSSGIQFSCFKPISSLK